MPNVQPDRRLRFVTPAEDYSHKEPMDAALDLIRRLKVYADRSASTIAHELCVEATEFVAKHSKGVAA